MQTHPAVGDRLLGDIVTARSDTSSEPKDNAPHSTGNKDSKCKMLM